MPLSNTILDIQSFNLSIQTNEESILILKDITFNISEGEFVGLFGPSGSGKSMLLKSIIKLHELIPNAKTNGSIVYQVNQDVCSLHDESLASIRKNEIAYVFQTGQNILNPSMTISQQLMESCSMEHTKADKLSSIKKQLEFLGFTNIEHIQSAYPHELSGGQIQRVLLAVAILREVKVLLIDEPTSALDSELKREIIEIIKKVNLELGVAVLLVSHNLELVEDYCDRVLFIKNGELVESDPFKWAEVKNEKRIVDESQILFEVKDLSKSFKGASLFRNKSDHQVFNDFSTTIDKNDIIGIAGPSGSGKSTLAKILCALDLDYKGSVLFNGQELNRMTRSETLEFRKKVQIIFQDPLSSLSPHLTIKALFEEVLSQFDIKLDDWEAYFEEFGLGLDILSKLPSQLSGGQRQRFYIAKTLLINPWVLICDEITSSLDIDVRAQILNLLFKIHQERGLTLIFVSHDEKLLDQFCYKTIRLFS